MQSTHSVIVVRPANFRYNAETAVSNFFQNTVESSALEQSQKVSEEFNFLLSTLKKHRIEVRIIDDTDLPIKPDAIFPNNWISTHAEGIICLYPMLTPNRQAEVRWDVVESLKQSFVVSDVLDLTPHIEKNEILEGTGSIVLDRTNQIAYACLSARTNESLFWKLCQNLGYTPITFEAYDKKGKSIYHTNVMMSIGSKYAVICLESIPADQREKVSKSLSNSGLEIFEISQSQMSNFAGNVIELTSTAGKKFLMLSQSAFDSLSAQQKSGLSQYVELVPIPIPTIEKIGGGSIRCMIAENFLSPS